MLWVEGLAIDSGPEGEPELIFFVVDAKQALNPTWLHKEGLKYFYIFKCVESITFSHLLPLFSANLLNCHCMSVMDRRIFLLTFYF